MANKDNQKFIYVRSLKEKIPCTEEEHKRFYAEVDRLRHREQYHGRCKCPKQYIWACDGDCDNCEHHLGHGYLSLDETADEDGTTYADLLPDDKKDMASIIEDRLLLEQLIDRFRELEPKADDILALWNENDKLSDREIAKALGIPQRTFAEHMKKYRAEFRKIRGY